MLFRQINDSKLAQYAYLIGCQRTGEAIVFDPERDVDQYIAAAAREGAALIFTHALVHRGQAVPAAADGGPGGGGVSRLFGYVLGGHAGGTGMPADAFARLGYEETRVGAFEEEEEVEWPTAEEDGGEGKGDGAALPAT
jgi:hypothetical protein